MEHLDAPTVTSITSITFSVSACGKLRTLVAEIEGFCICSIRQSMKTSEKWGITEANKDYCVKSTNITVCYGNKDGRSSWQLVMQL